MGGFMSTSSDDDVLKALQNKNVLIADVRSPGEFAQGDAYPGAVNIPVDSVTDRIKEFGTDLERNIITYCAAGVRAGSAASSLREFGFRNVFSTTNAGHLRELAKRIPK
jgi:rhodanese-related sulfurtransferase